MVSHSYELLLVTLLKTPVFARLANILRGIVQTERNQHSFRFARKLVVFAIVLFSALAASEP